MAAWVLVGSLTGLAGGCNGERAGGLAENHTPLEQELAMDALHPEYREEEQERRVVVSGELAQLRPAALLAVGEQTLVWPLNGPARVRVSRQGGQGAERVVTEIEAEAGQMLLVDRLQGVKLSGETVVTGPLERSAGYAVYLLPPGGIRQEAVQRRYRPATPQEIRQAERQRREAEAAEEAQRRAEQMPDTATQPTAPANPPPQ